MDVIKKFDAAEEREDVNACANCALKTSSSRTPEWVTKNKADFKMKNEEGVCQRHDQVFGR